MTLETLTVVLQRAAVTSYEAYASALMSLPGVGLGAATVADLSALGSLRDLACCPAQEVEQLTGCGQHQAAALQAFWTTNMTNYQ